MVALRKLGKRIRAWLKKPLGQVRAWFKKTTAPLNAWLKQTVVKVKVLTDKWTKKKVKTQETKKIE